jgi:hypothetical protein
MPAAKRKIAWPKFKENGLKGGRLKNKGVSQELNPAQLNWRRFLSVLQPNETEPGASG